jgi:peptidoglycan/LPS O-acetylase OafA/YrhL
LHFGPDRVGHVQRRERSFDLSAIRYVRARALSRQWRNRAALGKRLGLLSYSIYLLHPVLVAPHHGLVGELGARVSAPWAVVLVSTGTFALLFALSELTYRFIERPGRRWVQQLGRGVLGKA